MRNPLVARGKQDVLVNVAGNVSSVSRHGEYGRKRGRKRCRNSFTALLKYLDNKEDPLLTKPRNIDVKKQHIELESEIIL